MSAFSCFNSSMTFASSYLQAAEASCIVQQCTQMHLSSDFRQSCVTQALRYISFHNGNPAQERQKWPYPRSMFH